MEAIMARRPFLSSFSCVVGVFVSGFNKVTRIGLFCLSCLRCFWLFG
jgi:hypothetical protein